MRTMQACVSAGRGQYDLGEENEPGEGYRIYPKLLIFINLQSVSRVSTLRAHTGGQHRAGDHFLVEQLMGHVHLPGK